MKYFSNVTDATTGITTQVDWTQEQIDAYLLDANEVPNEVSMRQARLALFQNGLLSTVQSSIDAMPDPEKTVSQITWDYATSVYRNATLVTQLASQLGLTDTDLDNLFILAATL